MMPGEEVVEVPDAEDMDNETFIRHLELRHKADCRIETFITRNAVEAWIGPYRAFHDRLHSIEAPGQYNHTHEEEEL